MIAAVVAAGCGTDVIHHQSRGAPDGAYVADWEQDMGRRWGGFRRDERMSPHAALPFLQSVAASWRVGFSRRPDHVAVTPRTRKSLTIRAEEVVTTMFDSWRDVKIRFERRPLDLPR